jgi:hypothetical protein
LVLAGSAFSLGGCVSGLEKFYRAAPGSEQLIGSPVTDPPPAMPKVYSYSSSPQADMKRLAEDGFFLIGTSSLYGPANQVHESQVVDQGRKVGASVILMSSQYVDTIPGSVNAPGTVNAYGTGGYETGNFSSTSTTTTPANPSTYDLPHVIPRDQFFASYWGKQDPGKMRIGLRYTSLPDPMRRQLERNNGVYVAIVVRGTPASRSNILEGDVITKINGEDVVDYPGFDSQLSKFAGQAVILEVFREGQARDIPVTLNTGR